MKSLINFLALLVVWSSCAMLNPQEATAQQVSVSFQVFYDQLSPYGMWVEYPSYGYVWIPNAEPGFSPYVTFGHWVFTDDGWTWVSDYPWGWATFHYGRWDYDNAYGWLWVPDNEWGPAWVSWRRSPGYYGWAPLRPGISVSVASRSDYHERNERWIFVRERDITRSDVDRHYVNRANNLNILNNSTAVGNTRTDGRRNVTYIAGPDRNDVQKATQTTVKSITVRESDQPGHHQTNSELQIYRPRIQKLASDGQSPVPSKVMRLAEVRPLAERNAGNRQQDISPALHAGKEQPSDSRNVPSAQDNGKGRQLSAVIPPVKSPPQQPLVIASTVKSRSPNPRNVTLHNNKGKEQQPPTVARMTKSQSPKIQTVRPTTSNGKDEQLQNNASRGQTHMVPPSVPRSNQGEKDKGRRE